MIAIFILWLFVFALVRRTTAIAEDIVPDEFLSNTVLIQKYGGKNSKEILALGKCESSLDETKIHYNDGRKGVNSYYLFQYQKDTWNGYNKLFGTNFNLESRLDQIKMTQLIMEKRPQDVDNTWVICFKKYKNSV